MNMNEIHSGRFSVRVPKQLHDELIRQAKSEGVSLNQYVNLALTVAVCQGRVIEKLWEDKVEVKMIQVNE
jgi:hypothetical protein